MNADFDYHQLDDNNCFYSAMLPAHLILDDTEFATLWDLHLDEFHEIFLHGRFVKTPRWQQAYGRDYHYTGNLNKALPIPEMLEPILKWSQQQIDERLNGLLLVWYDGSMNHYIGKHRDSTKGMCDGAPIVTISFGEERVFRLRPWKQSGMHDFKTSNGRIFVMPYETNKNWTHEVPKAKRYQGRRISITLRAFH